MSSLKSIAVIRRGRISMLLNPQLPDAACSYLVHIRPPIGHSVYPATEPRFAISFRLRLLVILPKESIVPLVISLYGRRVSAKGTFHDGVNHEPRDNRAVRIAGNDFRRNNLLRHHDHPFCCADPLDHHSKISPAMSIALA